MDGEIANIQRGRKGTKEIEIVENNIKYVQQQITKIKSQLILLRIKKCHNNKQFMTKQI